MVPVTLFWGRIRGFAAAERTDESEKDSGRLDRMQVKVYKLVYRVKVRKVTRHCGLQASHRCPWEDDRAVRPDLLLTAPTPRA